MLIHVGATYEPPQTVRSKVQIWLDQNPHKEVLAASRRAAANHTGNTNYSSFEEALKALQSVATDDAEQDQRRIASLNSALRTTISIAYEITQHDKPLWREFQAARDRYNTELSATVHHLTSSSPNP